MINHGKVTIDLLTATKAVVERDIALGLVSEDDMRLSIQGRKRTVEKLAAAGVPERQIAKAVGASRGTVRNDLGRSKSVPKLVQKYTNEAAASDEIEPENYRSAYLLRADQALRLAHDCEDLVRYLDEAPKGQKEIAQAARAAALAWSQLAQTLEEN